VYAAYLRGDLVEQAWKRKLPKGAPDIIIKNIKDESYESYFAMGLGLDQVEGCSSDSESEHSSRFQIGFQIPKIRLYKGDSFIPNNAGKLMHLSLDIHALR